MEPTISGRLRIAAASGALALIAIAGQALAAAGDLDPSFGVDGKRTVSFSNGMGIDQASAVAIQPNGKVLLAGNSFQGSLGGELIVVRLRPDGSLDPTFSGDGKRFVHFAAGNAQDSGRDITVQPDGKIVVAGYSDQAATSLDFAVARLGPGGGLDPSFSGDGKRVLGFDNGAMGDIATSVAVQGDGRIVLAGQSVQPGLSEEFALARLRPDGTLDPAFSGDGKRLLHFFPGGASDQASAVALARRGRMVVAGATLPASDREFAVAKLRAGGGLDPGFSGDGKRVLHFAGGAVDDSASAVAIQPDGGIVLCGQSDPNGNVEFALARLRPGGRLDPAFSGDGKRLLGFNNAGDPDRCGGVVLQGDGRIVAAGESAQPGHGLDFAVARLLANGNVDPSFSADGKRTFGFDNGSALDSGEDVALSNGRIVVGGSSSQAGTSLDFAAARLLGG